MNPSPGPVSAWAKTAGRQVLFLDELNHRVLIEDASGELRIADGEFRYPRSVAVHESKAYVVDSWNHRVQAFELPEWRFAFEFGSFFCPSSIVVSNSLLVIADTNNRRLAFHRLDGTCAFHYELNGFPKRVEAGADGTLVVHYDSGETEALEY